MQGTMMDIRKSVASLDVAGHLIRRLNQQSTLLFTKRTQDAGFDLTPVQYAALETIYQNPGIDQARVAELIGYDRATIGGVIERLEKKAWIRRVVSEHDRRARELSLTAKGNSIRSNLTTVVRNMQKEMLLPLADSEQTQLLDLLRKVVWSNESNE
jgi:DNA-binding MarR family transcriptional regulator